MNSANQIGNRMVLQNSTNSMIDAYVAQGYDRAKVEEAIRSAVLSQSYIRLEQQLQTGVTNIGFPLLVNESNSASTGARPTEQRLNLQDAFFVSSVMLYISKVATTTSTNMLLNTYPNPITYPLGAATTGGHALNNLYNGKMTININNHTIIPGFDLMRFNQIPQTQLTGQTNPPQDMFDGTAADFMEPNPVFIGSKKTNIFLSMPGQIPTLEATPVYAVLLFRGILAQNVTVVS